MKGYDVYRVLTWPLGLMAKPVSWLTDHLSTPPPLLRERLGKLPVNATRNAPYDLWIHGVSVGEAVVVKAILDRLDTILPDANIVVSSFTEAGYRHAIKLLGKRYQVVPYPLDLPQVTSKVVSTLNPRVYCCVETELWPNLLYNLKVNGTKLLLLNGRISSKSFKDYRRLSWLFGPVLQLFDHVCVISQEHRARLVALGAKEDHIEITGNAKYEELLYRADTARASRLADKLGIPGDRPIFVAGSIRADEHIPVIQALLENWPKPPRPLFIIAPRHMNRVIQIEQYLKTKGLNLINFSQLLDKKARIHSTTDCILVDTIGWLFDLYGLCTAAFVGGSLVPLGGQNIMEPAAWKRPVIFGPYIDNFNEAAQALKSTGGGIQVKNTEELAQTIKTLLEQQERSESIGRAAWKGLESIAQNAAHRQAEHIARFLAEKD